MAEEFRSRRWTAAASLALAELTCKVFQPVAAQRLRLVGAPASVKDRLGDTELGAALLSGEEVAGRTAVLGGPYFGESRTGQLALAELQPETCEVRSLAGVAPAAWAAHLASGGHAGRPARWLAAVRARDVAKACGTLLDIVEILQAAPADNGASAILLLGNAGTTNSPTDAPWWPPGLPELRGDHFGNPTDVVIPSLWLSGRTGDELADALSLDTSTPASRGRSGTAATVSAAAVQGLLGVTAELSWNSERTTLATFNADRAFGGQEKLVTVSDTEPMTMNALHQQEANVNITHQVGPLRDILEIELWSNPVSVTVADDIRELAEILRPLRDLLRLVMRWSFELHTGHTDDRRCMGINTSGLVGWAFLCLPHNTIAHRRPHDTSSTELSWSAPVVFQEITLQKCLRRYLTSKVVGEGVIWEYLERLYANCRTLSSNDKQLSQQCSIREMESLGIDSEAILKCSEDRFALLLEEAQAPQPGLGGSGITLRIAGWTYSGPLSAEAVLAAVCAALTPTTLGVDARAPPACDSPWRWHSPRWFVASVPLWPHGVYTLIVSSVGPLLLPCACRSVISRLPRCCQRQPRTQFQS